MGGGKLIGVEIAIFLERKNNPGHFAYGASRKPLKLANQLGIFLSAYVCVVSNKKKGMINPLFYHI